MHHELKLSYQFFDDVRDGKKNAEIRKNDRWYSEGDTVAFREVDGNWYETGRRTRRFKITHVLTSDKFPTLWEFAILSIKPEYSDAERMIFRFMIAYAAAIYSAILYFATQHEW